MFFVSESKIDEMQGAGEEQTESYRAYYEGAPEPATKQIAILVRSPLVCVGTAIIEKSPPFTNAFVM